MSGMGSFPVNYFTLMQKAHSLKPKLSEKSEHVAKMSISCFIKKNRLVHHMATHKSQCHPSEVEAKALQFLDVIRTLLIGPNRDLNYVIKPHSSLNILQNELVGLACTPSTFACQPWTWNKRITFAITVTVPPRSWSRVSGRPGDFWCKSNTNTCLVFCIVSYYLEETAMATSCSASLRHCPMLFIMPRHNCQLNKVQDGTAKTQPCKS